MKKNTYSGACSFLKQFFELTEHAVELRLFENEGGGKPKRIFTRDADEVGAFCRKWDVEGRGMFFGVCTRRTGSQKGSRAEVVECRAVWVDIDTLKEGLNKDDIASKLQDLPCPPTWTINSGGGLHAYWAFREPIDVSEIGGENETKVVAVLKQLAGVCAGDSKVCELARVMRLPDTSNSKPGVVEAEGGFAAKCEIIHETGAAYEIDDLIEWLDYQRPVVELPKPKGNGADTDENPYTKHAAAHRANKAPTGNGVDRYADAAFADEIQKLSGAQEGRRNKDLYTTALKLSGFVAAGRLDGKRVKAELHTVARQIGLNEGEIGSTIESGFAAGEGKPKYEGMPEAADGEECKPQEVSDIDQWPTPLDIFGDTALVGQPDLPEGCLPDIIEDFARDEAERLGVDPAMIALPCLATAAAALDDGFTVQPQAHDTEWRESARIWIAVVAPPAIKKTPSIDKATKPLKRVENRWTVEDEILLEAHRVNERVYNKELEAYARNKAKKKAAEIPDPPTKPRIRRKIVGDTTIEALSEILVDNPGGVLCVHDELSGWFGSFDAYHGTHGKDRAAWMEIYNGGPRAVDRIKRGRVLVKNWSSCLVGGIQPGPMRRLVGKLSDDGLVQRFIVIYGRLIGDGEDREPDYSAINAYDTLIADLANKSAPEGVDPATLSPEAQHERARVANIVKSLLVLPSTSAPLRAHLSKWDGLFNRILLTFHAVERVSTNQTPGYIIKGETAARVRRLMLEFLLPHTMRFYTEIIGQSEDAGHSRWIAGYILAGKLDKITMRDIGRAYRKLRDDRGGIYRSMSALDLAGWVSPIEDQRGRPPSAWSVNPRVHEVFAVRADAERKRRERVKEKVAQATKALGLTGGDEA